jgi:hypothetical protein
VTAGSISSSAWTSTLGTSFGTQNSANTHTFLGGSGTPGMVFVKKQVDSDNQDFINFYDNAGGDLKGTIRVSAGNLVIDNTSDARLKENIRDLTGGLDRIRRLKPRTFDWIAGVKNVAGFIAQEVEGIVPDAVSDNVGENGDVTKTFAPTQLIVHLVSALQELADRCAALEARVA